MINLPVRPMKAKLAPTPTDGRWPYPFGKSEWYFERKMDGYRMIAVCRPGQRPLLFSSSGRNVSADWPELHEPLSMVLRDVVLDGEVVQFPSGGPGRGKESFQLLAGRARLAKAVREEGFRFLPFDVLYANGRDLQKRPLEERKVALLEETGFIGPPLEPLVGDENGGKWAWETISKAKFEGIIAKPKASMYRQGERGTWLKFKVLQRDTFYVAGFTAGEGNRAGSIAALVLMRTDTAEPTYGGKVGTGFDTDSLAMLMKAMKPLQTEASPFDRRQMMVIKPHLGPRAVTWVRPELKAVVEFAEYSDAGIPRFPSFKGLERER